MGLMDFGQYELKMLQEVQTHSEVSKNSLVFFCFVPCLEARNQRITKHKPLMVFQGQKQQLGLHSWKLLIIASLGYKTSFNHRKFLAKRENKTKQNNARSSNTNERATLVIIKWWNSMTLKKQKHHYQTQTQRQLLLASPLQQHPFLHNVSKAKWVRENEEEEGVMRE